MQKKMDAPGTLALAEAHPELDLLLVDSLLCNPQMNNDDVLDEVRSRLCPTGKVVTQTFGRWIAADPPGSAGG